MAYVREAIIKDLSFSRALVTRLMPKRWFYDWFSRCDDIAVNIDGKFYWSEDLDNVFMGKEYVKRVEKRVVTCECGACSYEDGTPCDLVVYDVITTRYDDEKD